MRPILYSSNVFLKLLIQERFFNDVHYVWCSEYFDSEKEYAYSTGALVGASSNPADIYRQLKRDVDSRDQHSLKIQEQRASFNARAIEKVEDGGITQQDKEDIIYMTENADILWWRPLIYVIPVTDSVRERVQKVPLEKCASLGPEYIIADLKRSEFDVIEL